MAHPLAELRSLLEGLGLRRISCAGGIFLPGGGWAARALETLVPRNVPFGAFLAVAADCS